jgi:hypothetical protein
VVENISPLTSFASSLDPSELSFENLPSIGEEYSFDPLIYKSTKYDHSFDTQHSMGDEVSFVQHSFETIMQYEPPALIREEVSSDLLANFKTVDDEMLFKAAGISGDELYFGSSGPRPLHTYYNYKRACFDASPALLPHGSETPSTSKQKSPDDNLLINEFEMSEFEDRNEFEMVHETFKRLEKPASTLGSDVIGDFISDFTLSQINGNQSIISQLVGSDFERKGVGSKLDQIMLVLAETTMDSDLV